MTAIRSVDVSFPPLGDNTTIFFWESVYLLPDPVLAELVPQVVWCEECNDFRRGELVRSDLELAT